MARRSAFFERYQLRDTLWNKLIWLLFLSRHGSPVAMKQYPGTPLQDEPTTFFAWWGWALFGNALDGPIGDTRWNPEQKDTFWVRVKWWLRNPCHNLTWHVLGFAQLPSDRWDYGWADEPGWNYAFSIVDQNAYPYWYYIGTQVVFYFGWRGRGTFGIKLNLNLSTT